jgi:multisubunit Na+/H+ antiporter MnhB subunit
MITSIYLISIVTIIAILIAERRNVMKKIVNEKTKNNSKIQLLGILIFLGLFVPIFMYLRSNLEFSSILNPFFPSTFPEPTPNGTTTVPPPSQIPSPSETFWSLNIVILSIIGIVTVIVLIKALWNINEEELSIEGSDLRKSVLNLFEKAIGDTSKSLDIESSIIRCYYSLLELLAKTGLTIESFQTVREFQIKATKVLDIPGNSFTLLTGLFEEARYSIHKMDKSKRDTAVKCLKEIRRCLKGD